MPAATAFSMLALAEVEVTGAEDQTQDQTQDQQQTQTGEQP